MFVFLESQSACAFFRDYGAQGVYVAENAHSIFIKRTQSAQFPNMRQWHYWKAFSDNVGETFFLFLVQAERSAYIVPVAKGEIMGFFSGTRFANDESGTYIASAGNGTELAIARRGTDVASVRTGTDIADAQSGIEVATAETGIEDANAKGRPKCTNKSKKKSS